MEALLAVCSPLQHVPLHLACAILVVLQKRQSDTDSGELPTLVADRSAALAARCCQDVADQLSSKMSPAPPNDGIDQAARAISADDIASALERQEPVLRDLRGLFSEMLQRLHRHYISLERAEEGFDQQAAAYLPAESDASSKDCFEKVQFRLYTRKIPH